MHTYQELRDRFVAHAKTAQDIAEKAQREGRDFTEGELQEAQHHLAKARELKPLVEQAKRDQAVMAEISALGQGIGDAERPPDSPTGGPSGRYKSAPVPGKVRATGGSGWGESITRYHNTLGTKSLLTSGSVPVTVPLEATPIRDGEPVLSLRQLIPFSRDEVGVWSYMRQTLRDNNARTVAKGTRKPTSAYTVERVDERTRTIAHLSEPLNIADLADAPALAAFIEREMRLGFELALEDEIINGDGTTTTGTDRMVGIANTSGVQVQAWDTNHLITTRRAITKLETISIEPTGWLLHPTDWEAIELSATSNGDFYMTQAGQQLPVERATRRLWGVPVVVSTSVAAGVGYLADFAGSTAARIREEARLDWFQSGYVKDLFGVGDHGDLVEANKVVARVEGRAGFAVTRPVGVVELDLTAV